MDCFFENEPEQSDENKAHEKMLMQNEPKNEPEVLRRDQSIDCYRLRTPHRCEFDAALLYSGSRGMAARHRLYAATSIAFHTKVPALSWAAGVA
ncbi:MAG: hypothetical protein ACRD3O_23690, partial [Terriglobia bacterium]